MMTFLISKEMTIFVTDEKNDSVFPETSFYGLFLTTLPHFLLHAPI